jgi:hypothetical protein
MFSALRVQGFALQHFEFFIWSTLREHSLINVSVFYFIGNLDVCTTKQRPGFTIYRMSSIHACCWIELQRIGLSYNYIRVTDM